MPRPLPAALLLCCLSFPASIFAQEAAEVDESEMATSEQDLGVLQAELARIEAERQRLADELASGAHQQLAQLEQENQALRAERNNTDLQAVALMEEQRQKWFLIGGATVAGSLLLGFLAGKAGGGRRRREWLN
ncbi:hypothetical protein [Pseudomonas sp. OIL-1]|uniref:hypothetical protein n=1 Tax=Pseudomonas sp. OIL-1 TaxID=2706126 RepID=UPI0013A74A3C|nr:hypothetical protein [Pseudomonas sp. OIL-1]QIB51678.1 hypothetical protein G3M63_11850 [Pseudomonas sp. OIL-1]